MSGPAIDQSVLLPYLRCPACGKPAALAESGERLVCGACGAGFAVLDGLPLLTGPAAEASPGPDGGVKQHIAGYYDETAQSYEESHGIGGAGGAWSIIHKYTPFFTRHLKPGWAVLEVGAGTGKITAALTGLAQPIIASDVAPGMLRFGRARNHLGVAVVADAERLPFRDAAFDAVVAVNALSYCVRKEAALAEVARVLKPGGTLLLVDMNYLLHAPYHLLAWFKEWDRARLWTRQLLQSTPWGWRRRLKAAGFEITESFEFNWVPHRFRPWSIHAVMIPLDAVLSRVPLVRRFAMRIGIAARKPGP